MSEQLFMAGDTYRRVWGRDRGGMEASHDGSGGNAKQSRKSSDWIDAEQVIGIDSL